MREPQNACPQCGALVCIAGTETSIAVACDDCGWHFVSFEREPHPSRPAVTRMWIDGKEIENAPAFDIQFEWPPLSQSFQDRLKSSGRFTKDEFSFWIRRNDFLGLSSGEDWWPTKPR